MAIIALIAMFLAGWLAWAMTAPFTIITISSGHEIKPGWIVEINGKNYTVSHTTKTTLTIY